MVVHHIGRQAHEMGCCLIALCQSEINLIAYVFGWAPIIAALCEAVAQGVRVAVHVDHGHALSGITNAVPERLAELHVGAVHASTPEVSQARPTSNI